MRQLRHISISNCINLIKNNPLQAALYKNIKSGRRGKGCADDRTEAWDTHRPHRRHFGPLWRILTHENINYNSPCKRASETSCRAVLSRFVAAAPKNLWNPSAAVFRVRSQVFASLGKSAGRKAARQLVRLISRQTQWACPVIFSCPAELIREMFSRILPEALDKFGSGIQPRWSRPADYPAASMLTETEQAETKPCLLQSHKYPFWQRRIQFQTFPGPCPEIS